MQEHHSRTGRSKLRSLVSIALIVAVVAAAFAATAGWLTPSRLTPHKIVDVLAPPGGAALGFRRNHAKGVCITCSFESNGNGVALSSAHVFQAGSYPATGRLNLATPDPKTPDGMSRVRGLGLRIVAPDRQEWRSAMIDAPFFPVATPQAFYELQKASADKADPDAMKKFAAAHPEIAAFGQWAQSAPFTASFVESRFNSLNSFVFSDAAGHDSVVRWSFVPVAQAVAVSGEDIKQRDPDFLSQDLRDRVGQQPARWKLEVTVAEPGDPSADPSRAWPEVRKSVDVGTLVVTRIEAEADGPCRELNFDPTVLPAGMRVSDDPFPAARSAAYSVSYNRRTAEENDYPHQGGQP
ncbi:catalase family peroxidase [soil metagenome]